MDSFYGDPQQNTSGQGEQSIVPEEIKKWNWGAFFLNWIWSIGNQVWIGLITLIPFIGFIMAFVLGIKGNEWAWKNKEWESIDHFLAVQKKWAKWGWIVFVCAIVFGIIFGILIIFLITGPLTEFIESLLFDNTQTFPYDTMPTEPSIDTFQENSF